MFSYIFLLIQNTYIKHKEIIHYIFFGVLTTLVNIIIYFILRHQNTEPLTASIFAWIFSVLFAFFSNKLYVFNSRETGLSILLKEICLFFSARLFSVVCDIAIIYAFFKLLHLNEAAVKVTANIFVIIVNYISSKLFVFRH